MSDFQKLTLKRYGRNLLILCGFILLVYGMIKFELVRYAVLVILTLTIVGGFAWAMIRVARWDWWLRGKLDKLCGWLSILTVPVIHCGVCSTN